MNERIISRILGNTHRPKAGTVTYLDDEDCEAICLCCDKVITSFYREAEEDRLGGWTAWRVK